MYKRKINLVSVNSKQSWYSLLLRGPIEIWHSIASVTKFSLVQSKPLLVRWGHLICASIARQNKAKTKNKRLLHTNPSHSPKITTQKRHNTAGRKHISRPKKPCPPTPQSIKHRLFNSQLPGLPLHLPPLKRVTSGNNNCSPFARNYGTIPVYGINLVNIGAHSARLFPQSIKYPQLRRVRCDNPRRPPPSPTEVRN